MMSGQPLLHPTASELGPLWCPTHNLPWAAKVEQHELLASADAWKHIWGELSYSEAVKFPKNGDCCEWPVAPGSSKDSQDRIWKSALIQFPQTLTTQDWRTWLKSYDAHLTWTTGSWEGYSRTSQPQLGTRHRRCSWAYYTFFYTPTAYISSPWNYSVELNPYPKGQVGGQAERLINLHSFNGILFHRKNTYILAYVVIIFPVL